MSSGRLVLLLFGIKRIAASEGRVTRSGCEKSMIVIRIGGGLPWQGIRGILRAIMHIIDTVGRLIELWGGDAELRGRRA